MVLLGKAAKNPLIPMVLTTNLEVKLSIQLQEFHNAPNFLFQRARRLITNQRIISTKRVSSQ